jgi:WD40 repeat protein
MPTTSNGLMDIALRSTLRSGCPTGGTLVTGSDDFSLILWDTETGDALATFEGHNGKVKSIAISPDGTGRRICRMGRTCRALGP